MQFLLKIKVLNFRFEGFWYTKIPIDQIWYDELD